MAEKLTVDLEKNSHYRVAYDLMQLIATYEGLHNKSDVRKNFLLLYRECYRTVRTSASVKEIIETSG